jgi:hypothetical protein
VPPSQYQGIVLERLMRVRGARNEKSLPGPSEVCFARANGRELLSLSFLLLPPAVCLLMSGLRDSTLVQVVWTGHYQ